MSPNKLFFLFPWKNVKKSKQGTLMGMEGEREREDKQIHAT